MSEPKRKGRKPGSRNKFPAHTKILDELRRHNFDYLEEHVSLFKRLNAYVDRCIEPTDAAAFFALQIRWFASFHEFVFPKRRPEDSVGKPDDSTDEKVAKAMAFREKYLALKDLK